MSVDRILNEAATVLKTAQRYSSELSEISTIDHEIHRMRVLITIVAAHTYSNLGDRANLPAEMHELQKVKGMILRAAEQRFGSNSQVLGEFFHLEQHNKTGNQSVA
jgi:hypothetical protein